MSGGGSSKPKSQAANYHMSVHYGLCTTVDSINKVFVNEVMIPEMETSAGAKVGTGVMTSNGTLIVRQETLFGGWAKQGGVAGHIDYMLGRPDQPVNAALCTRLKIDPAKAPAFRGIASLFMHDSVTGYKRPLQKGFLWSTNMPSLPPVWAEVTRIPFGPNGVKRNRGGHANPAHIIYECLTDTDWGMGAPVGLVDMTSFDDCADALDAEQFFLSLMWVRSSTIENFIGEILDHVQATLTTDPASGKLKLKLLRDDYDRSTLHIVHPGNASITKMQRKVWGETINDISVTWTNPDNEQEETVSAQDNGNIAIQGAVVSTSRNYYGIRNADLALKVAYRDLRQAGTPLLALEVSVNRSLWDAIVGDVVEVRWPELGIGSVIMRVGSINYGKSDDATIIISLMEDIFGLGTAVFQPIPVPKPGDPAPTYPPPAPGIDVPPYIPPYIPVPQPPLEPEVGEAPRALENHYLDSMLYFVIAQIQGDAAAQAFSYPEVGGMIMVNQPGTATSVVELWGDQATATGGTELTQLDRMPNGGRGTLGGNITSTQNVIATPLNWSGAGILVGQLLLMVNGEADNPLQELMAVSEVSADGSTLTVIRGVLDTNNYAWPAATPMWGLRLSDDSLDPMARGDGETVTYRFAPATNQGVFPVSSSPDYTHRINDRFYRPYRPVNLKAVGSDTLPISLSWARRNRLMETAQILSQTDQDVTPEGGQTTTLIFSGPGSSATRRVAGLTGKTYDLTSDDVALAQTGQLIIKAYAERDGFISREYATITVAVATSIGYGISYGQRYGD